MQHTIFKRIALMGREGTAGVPETLFALASYLPLLNCEVVLSENAANLITVHLPVIENKKLHEHADLLIVVGGDGSLLNAAHIAIDQHLPVLGVNRGRLGFLTDIHPNELIKIDAVLNGYYEIEERFLLHASIIDEENNLIHQGIALNDVVLLPADIAQMIEFEIYINNQFVCFQRADGLIIATPTGSTAYALSGGGPILHPALDAMVLVPMFPHTLSSRPIVVTGNSEIRLAIKKSHNSSPHVSCDGQEKMSAEPGSMVRIKKQKELLKLVHPKDYNYFSTLREKLNWEKQARREH